MQKAASTTDRIAACWYDNSGFSIDLKLTDGKPHKVSLYCLDWDTSVRQQKIEVFDVVTGTLLDTQTLSTSFHNGVYLTWSVCGHVTIKLTHLAGYNTLFSGLFFESYPATSTP